MKIVQLLIASATWKLIRCRAVRDGACCKDAYATLLSREDYFLGTFTLVTSLLRHQVCPRQILVLIPREKSKLRELGSLLTKLGATIIPVATIPNPYSPSEERFVGSSVMSKLHIFSLTAYDRILFLDSDIFLIGSPDRLFDFEPFAAVQRHRKVDTFQSSTMLLCPWKSDFDDMMSQLGHLDSYDGADQGFLNSFFKELWTTHVRLPESKHVIPSLMFPAIHAVGKGAHLSDAVKNTAVGVHFAGLHHKPWDQRWSKHCGNVCVIFHNMWLEHMQDVLNEPNLSTSSLRKKVELRLRRSNTPAYFCQKTSI